ncbi:MAG: alpha/beta hydrolase [Candidatus Lokiarchaeota archaeon]|nr:alpha/beta hydrolase [Candidatus Harpocratesius repetitus]
MKQRKIQLPTNQQTLGGILYLPEDDSSPTDLVILCHGFTGDQNEWGRFPATAEKFTEIGFAALTFDFSGSGKNPRIPITITQQVKDLESVFSWSKSQGFTKISIIGLSFGGLTSLLANIPERITTVFWAPAFYMRKIIGKKGFFMRIAAMFSRKPITIPSANNEPLILEKSFLDTIWAIDIEKRLQNFTESCLIIQGDADNGVLPKWTRKAYSLLPNKTEQKYIEVKGATHEFQGEHLTEFIDHSLKWIKNYHQK